MWILARYRPHTLVPGECQVGLWEITCKQKWTLVFIEGVVGHLFSLSGEAAQGLGMREEECIFFLETWLLSAL